MNEHLQATTATSPQKKSLPRQHRRAHSPIMRSQQQQHNQPDEGYSEADGSSHASDTEMSFTQDVENTSDLDEKVRKIAEFILTLPLGKRKDLVQTIIPTLPNEVKEELRAQIEYLTHFDPAVYLPNELVLSIFSYLSPKDLLTASGISRAWRMRAQDEKIWRACFAREGWVLDKSQMESFERLAERKGRRIAEGMMRSPPRLERVGSRKRGRDEAFSDGEGANTGMRLGEVGVSVPGLDGGVDERPAPLRQLQDAEREEEDEIMEEVEETSTASLEGRLPVHAADAFSSPRSSFSTSSYIPTPSTPLSSPSDFRLAPSIFQSAQEQTKLSWPYLYKQRRRLESNWENGHYKAFQLPSPEHPEDGHEECVYTIQHTTRHLVSGSRDRTIRIWDLSTYRLKGEPLRGHEASVLCLQFDERPDQDIIVSGGSDAFVIVWRFSTGEILKKMTRAHDESVLNLRFDDRYIVTCSKDKTIKVWSRHALARDSPLIPKHVLQNFAETLAPGEMVKEYTLLTSLLGHAAAVNAVMIHDNIIVSASGDRTIKSWDLSTGQFKKNYVGHTKGIACVQFDGRRIVSGSSDNTVRIFDAEQQAEVACLTGHTNLVRTVQARFGDLAITSAEELADEAKKADLGYYRALAQGMRPASASRRGARNAGSSRPEEMLALGTRVPPGGGGSRWAKIVSGSYDETVILWKRDREGKWCPCLTLRQDDVLRAGRRRRAAAVPTSMAQATQAGSATAGALAQAQAHHHIATAQGHLVQANQLLQTQHQQGQGHQLLPNSQMVAMASAQNHFGQQLGQQPPAANNVQLLQQHVATQVQQQQQQITTTVVQNLVQTANTNGAQAAPNPAPAPQQNPPAGVNGPTPAPGNAAAAAPGNGGGQHRESNRVFKLQFDARRIVCCSQNKIIVGWDFANGDPELERMGEWSLETA